MKRLWLVTLALIPLVGCNGGKNATNVELVQNMMDQEHIKSQDWDPLEGDKVQMRQPPAGTVPRGFYPYKYSRDPVAAENKLVNPLAADMKPETLSLGKKYYNTNCAVCHGDQGKGDGTVAEKMAVRPPSLLTDRVRGYKDGRVFHIITAGQGVMGSYASQIINPQLRWAVVNYVRSLQRGSQVAERK